LCVQIVVCLIDKLNVKASLGRHEEEVSLHHCISHRERAADALTASRAVLCAGATPTKTTIDQLWRLRYHHMRCLGTRISREKIIKQMTYHLKRARGPETASTVSNIKFEKYPSKFHDDSGIELCRQCSATCAITGLNRMLTAVHYAQLYHKLIKRTRDVMRYSSHRVLRRGYRAICINLGTHSTLAPRWRRGNGCAQLG